MLQALSRGGLEPAWERVDTAEGLRAALAAKPWDAVISEYSVLTFGAPAALEVVRAFDPDLPFIVVSGAVGEDVAVTMMRASASDYVLKHDLVRLAPAVEREVREAQGRRARRAAARAAAHLAAVVESSDDAIITKNLDGVVTTWNPAAEALYGWAAAEAVGRHASFLIPDDKAGEFAEHMARLRAGDRVGYFDTVRLHRDGRRIDVAMTVSPVRDAEGRLMGVSKTARDIRERRLAEAALRQSEERYRGLIESIPALVWVYDAAGRPLLHNHRWYDYTGQSQEAVATGRWHEALHPDDAAGALAAWSRATASGEPYSAEYRLRRADGAYRWFLDSGAVQRGPGGEAEQWVGVCTDIDARKRAEDDLRQTADLLRGVAESTPDAIFVKDLAGKYLLFNQAASRFVGRPVEEVLGRDDTFLFGPEDARGVMERDRRVRESGVSETEEEVLTAAGVTRTYLATKSPYRDRSGVVAGVLGTSHDITEAKKTEQAVRASEGRFRAFMDNTPAAAFIKDEGGRFLYVNPAWRRQFDPEPADWEGKTDYDFWPRDVADLFQASDRECLAGGVAVQREETGRTAAGEETTWLVMKFPLGAEGRRVGGMAWDITARRRAEDALVMRDRAVRAATQGLTITDPGQPDDPIVYVSPGFERMTGYAAEEFLGRNCRFLQGKDTDPAAVTRLREAIRVGEPCTVELLNYRKDGTTFWNELSVSPVRDAEGRLTHFVGVQVDVTARRALEEQFRQVQKMEAVGQLAAGVAHDFNNLLTIINGYSDLLLQDLPPGDPSREPVSEILAAGERSAGLTRQLLAFSRQQVLAPRVLSLNDVVAEAEKMLRRLVGEDVRLTAALGPAPWPVLADGGQVEQVLMNLVVNARDAMPTGGRITIETRNVELDESYARAHPDARPGPHVVLIVADTGAGMTPDVAARVFEPFFTTKGPGKGTGLGLATAYGIVRQSGGHVAAYSEVGVGTTFKVYLPQATKPKGGSKVLPGLSTPPRGTETVLLAEDDAGVRALTRHVLAGCGYAVLEAADGEEAVRVAAAHAGPIDLLVTDVVMPGAGGRPTAELVAARHPGVRVLFVSGYTDDAVIRHGVLREGVDFLQKPFSPVALAAKVREVLDAPRRPARGSA